MNKQINFGMTAFESEVIRLLSEINDKLGKNPISRQRKPTTNCASVWESFREPYFAKYGVEPERNAKINGQLSQLSRRVAESEVQSLCNYYLSLNDAKYTRSYHSVGMLLQDCEILLTRMKSGVVITESKARELERRQESADASREFLQKKYQTPREMK